MVRRIMMKFTLILASLLSRTRIFDMQHTNRRKVIARSIPLLTIVFFTSACTIFDDNARQDAQSQLVCITPLDPTGEFPCRFDEHNDGHMHEEYYQQLLPIHQRDDVMKQRVEDENRKH
jgi:hypothetical protein